MTSKIKQRSVVNSEKSLSRNECILRECNQIYTDNQNGLVKIAATLDLPILVPRKKISIMLIGNHSAGKSSFINWYIEEHIQKTGVAIETQGFTLVTGGKKRESLTGNATLHLYPHYKPLNQFPNLINCLNTEVATSKQKRFPLITFIDTPGLVDGDMKYPFDVDKAILWMGNVVDLVFVFFDPIGQALCKRTLNIVEELNKANSGRMRFCLSKADEAGHESDRQRVMMQIVQEVCKRPGLNGTCFDMPTIFIPNKSKQVRCVNQIEDLCKDIEKTIDLTIQNNLNQLEKDCEKIQASVDKKIDEDNISRWHNFVDIIKGLIMLLIACLMHFLLFMDLLVHMLSEEKIVHWIGRYGFSCIYSFSIPYQLIREVIPEGNSTFPLTSFLVAIFFLFISIYNLFLRARRPVLTKRQKRFLLEQQEYVLNHVHSVKDKLYKQYLEQAIWEQDL